MQKVITYEGADNVIEYEHFRGEVLEVNQNSNLNIKFETAGEQKISAKIRDGMTGDIKNIEVSVNVKDAVKIDAEIEIINNSYRGKFDFNFKSVPFDKEQLMRANTETRYYFSIYTYDYLQLYQSNIMVSPNDFKNKLNNSVVGECVDMVNIDGIEYEYNYRVYDVVEVLENEYLLTVNNKPFYKDQKLGQYDGLYLELVDSVIYIDENEKVQTFIKNREFARYNISEDLVIDTSLVGSNHVEIEAKDYDSNIVKLNVVYHVQEVVSEYSVYVNLFLNDEINYDENEEFEISYDKDLKYYDMYSGYESYIGSESKTINVTYKELLPFIKMNQEQVNTTYNGNDCTIRLNIEMGSLISLNDSGMKYEAFKQYYFEAEEDVDYLLTFSDKVSLNRQIIGTPNCQFVKDNQLLIRYTKGTKVMLPVNLISTTVTIEKTNTN